MTKKKSPARRKAVPKKAPAKKAALKKKIKLVINMQSSAAYIMHSHVSRKSWDHNETMHVAFYDKDGNEAGAGRGEIPAIEKWERQNPSIKLISPMQLVSIRAKVRDKKAEKMRKTTATVERTEETALVRNRAILRSGSRRIADGMALILGAKNLRWGMSKTGNNGYSAVMKVRGWKYLIGRDTKVRTKTGVKISILSRKGHQIERDMRPEADVSDKGSKAPRILPYGFEFSMKTHNGNNFEVLAFTDEASKTPDKLIFSLASALKSFLETMAEDFVNMAQRVSDMYQHGELEDLDAWVEDNPRGDLIPARGGQSVRLIRDVKNHSGGHSKFHIELDMAKQGVVKKTGSAKIALGKLKGKPGMITLKTQISEDAGDTVFQFDAMCADLASKMLNIARSIDTGMSQRGKITKIITQGAKYPAVIRFPGGSLPIAPSHKTLDKVRKAVRF